MLVGVAGFEPALCLVPNEVPYQARRHSGGSGGNRNHTSRASTGRTTIVLPNQMGNPYTYSVALPLPSASIRIRFTYFFPVTLVGLEPDIESLKGSHPSL